MGETKNEETNYISVDRISKLRQIIQDKPKNARAMSELALLLFNSTTVSSLSLTSLTLKEEALILAKRATQVQPSKPFGFAALSQILVDELERRNALQDAIDRCDIICANGVPDQRLMVSCVGWMARQLVESRDSERKRIRGIVGAATVQHPNRRPLNGAEQQLVCQIEDCLEQAWSITSIESQKGEFLAKREYILGQFFRKIDKEKSIHFFQAARKHTRDSETRDMTEFWLGTLSATDNLTSMTTRCPASYVVGLYSSFADRFDELMVNKLDYQTPRLLRQLLSSSGNNLLSFRKALDLGCGTGLSGAAFCDVCAYLKGVDLSPEMIEKARIRGCYDELDTVDFVDSMEKETNFFDLVFACDTFCYVGDLKPIFLEVYRVLEPSSGGLFCFSVEVLDEAEDGNFNLHACARYAHKQSYIQLLARTTGFEMVQECICPLRKNQGCDVKGLLTVLKAKPRSPSPPGKEE